MTFEKVADHLRHSEMPLAAKGIVIISDQGDFTGAGKLQREGSRLRLEVTLNGERELPLPSGTYTREQFWKIGGVIEGQVPFWGVSLPDQAGHHSARFTLRTGRFGFDRIYHLAAYFEEAGLRDALVAASEQVPSMSESPSRGDGFARFTDYKLIWRETSTVSIEEHPYLGKTTRSDDR